MQSQLHLSHVTGFEHTLAESNNGGRDKVYFRDVVSADEVLAINSYTSINGPQRSVSAKHFAQLDIDLDPEEKVTPKLDLRATSFQIERT